jgi:uncharacterized protein (DUF1501 family)
MNYKKDNSKFGRRGALAALAGASGGLVLQSLATGIPASVLLNPLSAKAGDVPTGKTLILSTSSQGDPVNANIPGTYDVPGTEIFHSQDPLMAKTSLTLSGKATSAAKPWAQLGADILERTVFFHHASRTPVHGELNRVHKMLDETEKNDMLVSLIARELAPSLMSVQKDPLSLGASGGELLSSGGRTLGNVAPLSVRQALGGVDGPLKDLVAMRDKEIDRIYDIYRESGTPTQKTLLDAWARSRDEVRSISQDLVARLDAISGNDEINQVKTAAILAAMNIAPVITIHLNFGGDNHADTDFETETTKHVSALANVKSLMDELDALQDEGSLKQGVLVGILNVFGRTLKKKGYGGRDHNSEHSAMVLIGDGLKGGIVGGVAANAGKTEYVATAINSTTGASGGDIPFEDTLCAAGKSLAYALGVPEARIDEMIAPGKIVKSIVV